ncbi:MAG: hypothetical protein HQL03_09800 [Nitrospirae bacterium]|nr:hypothetical protein [Nitrospirota bacterium]
MLGKLGDKVDEATIRETLIDVSQGSEVLMKHLTGHSLKDIKVCKPIKPAELEDYRKSDIDLVIPNDKDVTSVLLVQFHDVNVEKMARWMLCNFVDAMSKYGIDADINQYLVYCGRDKLDMPSGINELHLEFEYDTIDVSAIDGAQNIDVDRMTQDITLAVLSGDADDTQSPVLRAILGRLREDGVMG